MTAATGTTSIPYNGSGTINIHVNNPMAGMPPMMPQMMPCMTMMPCMPYPFYSYPPNYYMNNLHPGGITQVTNLTPNGIETKGNGVQQPVNTNTTNTDANKSKKEREIVLLTDNYIKNLENYLRSNNEQLRKEAVKELIDRFKEDKSRMTNPSLTALLNLALQDTNASVRAGAMSIVSAGYAKGDNLTEQILKSLQTSKTNYSTDATDAASSLLQMSKSKAMVPDNSHYKSSKTDESKKGSK